jgi:hypothetical protein
VLQDDEDEDEDDDEESDEEDGDGDDEVLRSTAAAIVDGKGRPFVHCNVAFDAVQQLTPFARRPPSPETLSCVLLCAAG